MNTSVLTMGRSHSNSLPLTSINIILLACSEVCPLYVYFAKLTDPLHTAHKPASSFKQAHRIQPNTTQAGPVLPKFHTLKACFDLSFPFIYSSPKSWRPKSIPMVPVTIATAPTQAPAASPPSSPPTIVTLSLPSQLLLHQLLLTEP